MKNNMIAIDVINSIFYKIIETRDDNYVNIASNGESILGLCDVANRKIYLHKDLDLYTKRKTLRHELMHAVLYEYGLNKDSYTEEQICDLLGTYGEFICDCANNYFKNKEGE